MVNTTEAMAERDHLISECHKLINQISHRPGCIKLLRGAKSVLETYASYKKKTAYQPTHEG